MLKTNRKARFVNRSEQEINSGRNALLLQRGRAGRPTSYLGCHGMTGLDENFGEVSYQYCYTPGIGYHLKGSTQSVPGGSTFSIAGGVEASKSVLDQVAGRGKPATYFVKVGGCDRPDNPCDFDAVWIFPEARINSRGSGDPVAMGEDARIERTYAVTSPLPGTHFYRPYPKRKVIDSADSKYSTTAHAVGISVPYNYSFCGDACKNDDMDPCDLILAGNTSGAGTASATNQAGILISRDGGATWTFVAFPLGGDYDDSAFHSVMLLDNGTFVALANTATEIYAVFGLLTANSAIVSGSVTVGTGTGLSTTSRAVFSDGKSVWLAINNRIYVSDTGGQSWTLVYTGTTGDVLNDLHMLGQSGYAVGSTSGGASALYYTQDAGDSWIELTFEDDLGAINAVYTLACDVWVGTSTGLYRSSDTGATWENVPLAGGGAVYDVEFYDEFVGAAVSETGVHVTPYGGSDWCALDASVTDANEIEWCDEDSFWVIDNTTGNVAKYSPKVR